MISPDSLVGWRDLDLEKLETGLADEHADNWTTEGRPNHGPSGVTLTFDS